jgi:hypothetical protein
MRKSRSDGGWKSGEMQNAEAQRAGNAKGAGCAGGMGRSAMHNAKPQRPQREKEKGWRCDAVGGYAMEQAPAGPSCAWWGGRSTFQLKLHREVK